jgi:hypothetical protein
MCGKLILCLALVLSMSLNVYASDYVFGNWENTDSNEGWAKCTWGPNSPPTLTPGVTTHGVTLGTGALKMEADITINGGWAWVLIVNVDPAQFQSHDTFKLDITRLVSDWEPNEDVSYWNSLQVRVNSNTSGLVDLGNGNSWWAPADGDDPKTGSWDYSAVKAAVGASPSYLQFVIAINAQYYLNSTGIFYLDNARLVRTPQPAAITIKKCTVTAGKTQGADSEDINNIKDVFTASGTFSDFSPDLNNITNFDVSISTVGEDANVLVYNEVNNFDVCDVNHGKFKYSHKIPKGGAGAITSLTLDFNKLTFAITTKNIDLTGLACPLELEIALGDYIPSGEANEAIVNSKSKTIPTRLMRMYDDTLIVKKAKVKNSTKDGGDSLSVTGEIAVEDINNTDMDEPNLVNEDVNVVWGSQNFVIPASSFKAAKTGHSYKCSKIVADANVGNAGKVTAAIDLDKCTYSLSVSEVNLVDVDGDVSFGLRFADFNEANDVNVARGF